MSKSKGKKDDLADNKDEETIKRLKVQFSVFHYRPARLINNKSFVLACGVRKVWSKAFQGLDTPQEQIKKLKGILVELGMTGRMSMEQAKAIKQKRELAQELGTDICFFTPLPQLNSYHRGCTGICKGY